MKTAYDVAEQIADLIWQEEDGVDIRKKGVSLIALALQETRLTSWNDAVDACYKLAANYFKPFYERVDAIKALKDKPT